MESIICHITHCTATINQCSLFVLLQDIFSLTSCSIVEAAHFEALCSQAIQSCNRILQAIDIIYRSWNSRHIHRTINNQSRDFQMRFRALNRFTLILFTSCFHVYKAQMRISKGFAFFICSSKSLPKRKVKKANEEGFFKVFLRITCLFAIPSEAGRFTHDSRATRVTLIFFYWFFLRAPLRRMKNLLNWIEFVIEGMTNRFLYPLHGDPLSIPIANSFYFISSESVCLWIWIYQIYWGNIDVKRR